MWREILKDNPYEDWTDEEITEEMRKIQSVTVPSKKDRELYKLLRAELERRKFDDN